MDAHSFLTSPSGNVHGMPVAALLGKADEILTKMYPGAVFLKPENLKLIGVRSYEAPEYGLLQQLGIEIVYAHQISRFDLALIETIGKLSLSCQKIGISIDLDVIDPTDAPGVETPSASGIKAKELLAGLSLLNHHPKICGLEISEFNPEKDIKNKTLHLMKAIVETFYGEVNKPNKFLGSARSGIIGKSVPN